MLGLSERENTLEWKTEQRTCLGNRKISDRTTFYFIKLCGVELRSPAKDQMNKMREKLLMNKYAILGKSFHLFSSRIFYLEYLHIGKKTKKLKNSQRDYVIF